MSPQRAERILNQLKEKYSGKSTFDVDGEGGMHFACEIEPTEGHAAYDRCIEVVIKSKPHKHLKMTQHYTILSGTLELHVDKKVVMLKPGNKYTIYPGEVHWAKSEGECWMEIYSE